MKNETKKLMEFLLPSSEIHNFKLWKPKMSKILLLFFSSRQLEIQFVIVKNKV